MKVNITNADWQLLRLLARSSGTLPGWKLRLAPTRKNKTGEFLTKLCEAGLISRGDPCGVPSRALKDELTPVVYDHEEFHFFYTLTDLGRYAAEFGEYKEGLKVIDDGFTIETEPYQLFKRLTLVVFASSPDGRERSSRLDFSEAKTDRGLQLRRRGLNYRIDTEYTQHSFGFYAAQVGEKFYVVVKHLDFSPVGFVAYDTLEALKAVWELD